MSPAASLTWPIITLDFEASSLGPDSYPIEIGFAQWDGLDAPISTWSRLIRPTDAWTERLAWNSASQLIHGIRPQQLELGYDPDEVVELVNTRFPRGTIAYCDGGSHDQYWLDTLIEAAARPTGVRLASWGSFISALGYLCQVRMQHWVETHRTVHRAGPDAVDHLRGLAFALEVPEPAVIPWEEDA